MTNFAKLIATFFYVGYLPKAPGTWGSLAALPVAYVLIGLFQFWGFCIAILIAYFLGLWATKEVTKTGEDHDPSYIVIDEVAGQWIALLPTALGIYIMNLDPWVFLYPGYIVAFLLFRLFDITKPWLVGRADARGDATGVMLDDVYAGIFAAILMAVVAAIGHLVFM